MTKKEELQAELIAHLQDILSNYIGDISNTDIEIVEELEQSISQLQEGEHKESKGDWKNYKLIPMFDITDEAREIAVAWMECEDKDWIGQKHKLASDIMNYARKYAAQQPQKVEQEDDGMFMITEDGPEDIEQSESKTAKTAEEILLKHIGKAYNCRSVFHNRYIAAMEEYRQQHQKESKYCDCEQPDREIGYSYCHTCHRMVSDERIELILNQGSTAQQPQKVEQEEEKPTDEEIENFFKTHHFDNKNGHHYRVNKDRIFGAKAMRDNPQQFKSK